MSDDEIRSGLAEAAKDRGQADQLRAEATERLADLLRRARDADAITMTEAAKLGGVSRVAAYELVKAA
jgi:F0F1-type ATP synthase membrane subunit b/b'